MSNNHNDLYSIVERLRVLEEGLDKDQRSVNQLSATFKPKTVAVLTAKTDPKNPMAGKLVGGAEESTNPSVNRGGYNRLRDRHDFLDKRDHLQQLLIKTTDSADKEIIKNRMAELLKAAQQAGFAESVELDEAMATEDVLEKVKSSFKDFIKSVEDEIKDTDIKEKKKEDTDLKSKDKKDRDLIAKASPVAEDPTEQEPADTDLTPTEPVINPVLPESAPIKTMTIEDGNVFEIHGNERDGFEIRREGRCMRSRFENLDHAVMAVEMYQARRRNANESQDYLDEE